MGIWTPRYKQPGTSGAWRKSSSSLKTRSKFAAPGVIHSIISMLLFPNLDLRESSLLALRDERNNMKIVASGAIPSLVELKFHNDNLRELETAAILTLSAAAKSRPTIVASGAVPLLVQVLSSESVHGRVNADTALYNLSTCREDIAMVLDARAVYPLINLPNEWKKNTLLRKLLP